MVSVLGFSKNQDVLPKQLRICSMHFEQKNFINRVDLARYLKSDAVPMTAHSVLVLERYVLFKSFFQWDELISRKAINRLFLVAYFFIHILTFSSWSTTDVASLLGSPEQKNPTFSSDDVSQRWLQIKATLCSSLEQTLVKRRCFYY